MMEKVQQVKTTVEPANPYSNYGYGYTGPTHHYHKNAPKVTHAKCQLNSIRILTEMIYSSKFADQLR